MLFDEYPAIEDDVVAIHALDAGDADALEDMCSNETVYCYLPTFLFELGFADKREAIERMHTDCFLTRKSLHLGIYLKDDPAMMAGILEFYDYIEADRKTSIGYRLNERYWKHGLGTRVVGLARDYLIGVAGMRSITAHVMVQNGASGAVLLKNGFVLEESGLIEDWGFDDPVEVNKYAYRV